jgi:hypothetical protein
MNQLLIATLNLLLILSFSHTEARGRSQRPPPTAADEIAACVENQLGMTLITRKALYAAKNSLGDRMDSIQWPGFCQCFGPQHLELNAAVKAEGKKDADWYQKYEAKRDIIAVSCANSNSSGAALAAPTTAPVATATNNLKFENYISDCSKNSKGRLLNAQIHLQRQNNPRAKSALNMDPKKYCTCYANFIRQNLGDDLALTELTSPYGVKDSDLFKVRQAINGAYETCAKEQIPF